jgi:hypothetical protein
MHIGHSLRRSGEGLRPYISVYFIGVHVEEGYTGRIRRALKSSRSEKEKYET